MGSCISILCFNKIKDELNNENYQYLEDEIISYDPDVTFNNYNT